METILFIGNYQSFRDLALRLEPIITKFVRHQATVYIGDQFRIVLVGVDVDRARGYKWGTNFIVGWYEPKNAAKAYRLIQHLRIREGVKVKPEEWRVDF